MTILEARLDGAHGITLNDAIVVHRTENGLYLPLGELAQTLGFAITVNAEAGRASGWFLQPEQTFELEDCQIFVAGTRRAFEAPQFARHEEDLYIHEALIEDWFSIALTVDWSTLVLGISSAEALPVEQKIERQRRWEQAGRRTSDHRPASARVRIPYGLWDWPVLDLAVDSEVGRSRFDGHVQRDTRYKIIGAGDFLKMHTDLALAHSSADSSTQSILTMSRRDPDGGLLGALKAREFAFGDLGMAQDPLISNNILGRGVTLSSYPLDRPDEFDRIRLEGELLPGWDVELYKNGSLVAFQGSGGGNRYDFAGIPLEFGINRLRLVFYGPQGQIREQQIEKIIGPGMVKPAEHYFRLAAIEERSDRMAITDRRTGMRLSASYERGVNQHLSVGGSVKSLPLDDGRQHYATMHLGAALSRLYSRLELAADADGGWAAMGLFSSQIAGMNFVGESAHFFNDFTSERTRSGGPGGLLSRTGLRVDRPFSAGRNLRLSLGMTLDHERWLEGHRTDLTMRTSINRARWSLTDSLDMDWTQPADTRSIRNSVLFSTRLGSALLRGGLTHELHPEPQLIDIALGADWRFSPRTTGRFGISHMPVEDTTSYSIGVSQQLEHLALGANVRTTDLGDLMVGVSVSTAMLREPLYPRWLNFSSPQTRNGAVAAEVFLDQNANGQREADEPGLPGAAVRAEGLGLQVMTDEYGQIFLPGLPSYRSVDFTLAMESLEDPTLQPAVGRQQLVLRPGRTARLLVPVLPTGSIDGRAYNAADQRLQPVQGVRVELLSAEGNLIQATTTAYDGYYYFDQIPPGYYRIRVPSAYRAYRSEVKIPFLSDKMSMSAVDLILEASVPASRPSMAPTARQVRAKHCAPAPSGDAGFWVLEQAGSRYTIQLVAVRAEGRARRYIRQSRLEGLTGYFHFVRDGESWFAVLYGSFASRQDAQAALQSLPAPFREAAPWIRRFDEVHALIETTGQSLGVNPRGAQCTLAGNT